MRNGQLFLTLRNLDPERIFNGSAKITLTNDKDQQELLPMQISVAPGKEEDIAVTDARLLNGDWMMMVYDEGGIARLVRGASLVPKPATPPSNGQNPPAAAPEGPPAFVTGMYDATGGWKLAEQPTLQVQGGQAGGQAEAQNSDQNANTSPSNWSADTPTPPPSQQENSPTQVTITPRQIAITPENVTMEFDIAASKPLNYIVLSIRAGDYQDTRQALMTTPQGRVPFLIPINQAKGGFTYELKDEAGNTLAAGASDFQQIQK